MKFKKPVISNNIGICPRDKDTRQISHKDETNPNSETNFLAEESAQDVQCCNLEEKRRFGPCIGYFIGFVLVTMGVSTIIYTPFEMCLRIRLGMSEGLPPFDWWKNPPDEVLFRIHIFNVTNSEKFLSGEDTKLTVKEVGPIVFMEKLVHTNVTFNPNGTMTYTAKRTAVYLENMNTVNLNDTLIMPNFALLGMASYLIDAPFFAKFGFNLLLRRMGSEPLVNITVYNFLYNNSDPVLQFSEKMIPSMVPTNNVGILAEIYRHFEDVVTVYIGPKYGDENFFLIDQYDGSDLLPGYGNKCPKGLKKSTEGVSYPQRLTKKSVLSYWRKTICKNIDLYYEKDVTWHGINAYKFSMPDFTFNRTLPKYDDCFQGVPALPDGIIDVSPCYYGLTVGASFPHYLYGDASLKNYVNGLTPNKEEHGSFLLVEPITGIPLHSKARSQSNLIIKDLSGFSVKLQPFSNTIIPLFLIEYNQVGLPWYIYSLLYFTVNILPIFQYVFSGLFIVLGLLLFSIFIRRKRRNQKHLLENKKIRFESEAFLKA